VPETAIPKHPMFEPVKSGMKGSATRSRARTTGDLPHHCHRNNIRLRNSMVAIGYRSIPCPMSSRLTTLGGQFPSSS